MNKFRLFVENFLVYGLGGIISRIIPIIMVPIITRLMPNTTYYGLSDLSNTLVQFATAIAVLGLYDAMYRMFFENEEYEYKKKVCSTAFYATLAMSIVVFVLLIVFKNSISSIFFANAHGNILVYLSAVAMVIGSTNTLIAAPTRMQNKRKIYLITNTLSALISYGLAIPLLLKGYYVVALPVSAIISAITLETVFFILNRNWFSLKMFDLNVLKQLLVIGIPLIPNLLIYWVFNSCDKIMITNMIGVDAAGIYSVASKLGHTSQLIYTAFAGGWQFFAFSTMKEKNQVTSNSKIFEYMGGIAFAVTSVICACSYMIFVILFTGDYTSGYISAPYLFLAPLLQMLYQIIANQFLIVKKTWPSMLILGFGAIVNLFANRILIPILGIEGASIATLLGYVVSIIICSVVLIRMKQLMLSCRFIIISCFIVMYFMNWRLFFSKNVLLALGMAIVFMVVEILLYKKDIQVLLSEIKKHNKSNKSRA